MRDLDGGAGGDASSIKGKTVDDALIGNDKVLTYKTASGKVEYASPAGTGDMQKSTYDVDVNGVVDNSQKVEGLTVAQVRTHAPATHGNEVHSSTFLSVETDPTVDSTLKGVTKTQVQTHAPQAHTHIQTEITDLVHDATKIKGVTVDDAGKDNDKALVYKSASGTIEYVTVFGVLYKLMPSLTFYKDGSDYKMEDWEGNITTGTLISLWNSAKTLLPKGGIFAFKGNTTYQWTDEPVADMGGEMDSEWLIEGEGKSTIWANNVAGKSGLVIKNRTPISPRNIKIYVYGTAKYCIFGDKTGTSEASVIRFDWRNVWLKNESTDTANARPMYLINASNGKMDNIYIFSVNAIKPTLLQNDSATATKYGNIHIGTINFSVNGGIEALRIESTNAIQMNLILIDFLQIANNGATGSNAAVVFGQAAYSNKIVWCDIEDFDVGINFLGTATKSAQGNTVSGGYIRTAHECFKFSAYAYFNHVKDVTLELLAGTIAWSDAGSDNYNTVADTDWYNTAWTCTPNSTTICRGMAAHGKMYESWGYSTGTGAQQSIPHNLIIAPANKILLSERTTGGALARQSAAADATNLYITATNAKDYTWHAKI